MKIEEQALEEAVMTLVVYGGDARSDALEAISAATAGDFEKAEELMKKCEETLVIAHNSQTLMIQNEINGKETKHGLLMIHAQDHLMNAITIKDIAEQFIALSKVVYKK